MCNQWLSVAPCVAGDGLQYFLMMRGPIIAQQVRFSFKEGSRALGQHPEADRSQDSLEIGRSGEGESSISPFSEFGYRFWPG